MFALIFRLSEAKPIRLKYGLLYRKEMKWLLKLLLFNLML